jgi:hypothetical protein
MISETDTIISSTSFNLSPEALALINRDYIQSLHNKLLYARPTESERDFLLSEITRMEDLEAISGTTNQ